MLRILGILPHSSQLLVLLVMLRLVMLLMLLVLLMLLMHHMRMLLGLIGMLLRSRIVLLMIKVVRLGLKLHPKAIFASSTVIIVIICRLLRFRAGEC